jgi:two-component system nitrogen regulation response regulator NtrX
VSEEEITPAHLQLRSAERHWVWGGELVPLKDARQLFERVYVEEVLRRSANNVSQAARVLGLERSHFYRKLRALGLRPH